MKIRTIQILAAAPLVWACGANMPEPKQPLTDAISASRSAREVGAESEPSAKLHVKLADEQISAAKEQIAKGNNNRATYLLMRAQADAELALALSREQSALTAKRDAVEESSTTFHENVERANP